MGGIKLVRLSPLRLFMHCHVSDELAFANNEFEQHAMALSNQERSN